METAPGFDGLLCLPTTEQEVSVAKRIEDMGYPVMVPDGDLARHEAVYRFYEAFE